MGVGAFESLDVGEHSRYLRWLRGTFRKFLQHFEAKASQSENVFSLHEIGFLTSFFKKKSYYFTFASLKKEFVVLRP